MSTDKKTSIAFPTAAALEAHVQGEPRGGPDAEQQRQAQEAARALAEPLPTEEDQERAKRLKAKLDLYYWLRAQRWNQAARGTLEGAGLSIGWQLLRTAITWSAGPKGGQ